MDSRIDIRPLKAKVLSMDDPLKTVILSEPDSMPLSEYLAKAGTWLRMLRIKKGKA